MYQRDTNTISLGWFKAMKRLNRPQSSSLGVGDVRFLERGNDLVIAAAFTTEAGARAWLKKRRTVTLPEWER